MAENERGFHHPASAGHDYNRGGSTGGEGRGGAGKKAIREPTNHGGHTHEIGRRHEHDRRVEAVRSAHNSHHHAAPGGHGEAQRQHGLHELREEPGERAEEGGE